jgi:hypothetical protein
MSTAKVILPGNADLKIGSDGPRERQFQCAFRAPGSLPAVAEG